jgi:hypothetical protein
MDKIRNTENGNALFIILLAIVLFAALTFSITRSQSTVNDTADPQRAKIAAAEILRYGKSLRAAVDTLRMNGISESDIRFAHADLHTDYGTPGANPTAEVFNIQGGGAVYTKPKASWLASNFSTQAIYGDWYFTSGTVNGVGTPSGGNGHQDSDTTNEELIMVLPYVTQSVCIAIAEAVGWDVSSGDVPVDTGEVYVRDGTARFNGTFVDNFLLDSSVTNTLIQLGHEVGCLRHNDANQGYHFYQVLIAR